jgi:hypothetical protein
MTTKKFLYSFGAISLLSWVVHFTISFSEYSTSKIITAAAFLIIALTIYYTFVYVYFHFKRGELIVSAGLIGIALIILSFIIFTNKQ